jgi:hypothetical protein
MNTSPSSAREEAERLIAAILAAATLAANANPHWSTGSAECCVCPLCKVIAAVRDPDPEFVERLATGAGDLAAGLASFMRNVSGARPGGDAETGDAWEAATRDESAPPPAAKPMAKKAAPKKVAKKAVKKAGPRPADDA